MATAPGTAVPAVAPPSSAVPKASQPPPAVEHEDDDEEAEEEEPKLKYHRLGSTVHYSVTEVLKKDSASSMTVHEKFLGLGTNWGVVYVLDFNGNEIKRFTAHSATVNDLCIDETGEYIGSCSDDGKVVIHALLSTETQEHVYHRPITSLALDPDFHRKKTKSFALGGKAGQLIINSKSWFGAKDNIVHSGEGAVHCVRWRGSMIAWANDIGVKIYDTLAQRRIKYIERPKGSPRPDLHRANLVFENEYTLLIGWANMVRVALIKQKETAPGEWVRFVDIVASFELETDICAGIGSFGEYLVLLAYTQAEDENIKGKITPQCPELRIVSRSAVHEEIISDQLRVAGFEEFKSTDYQLQQLRGESLYYVVSPRDIVVARPRDLDDHISWLLEREKYDEALTAAEADEKQMKDHKLADIGEKYLGYLLQNGDVAKAANLCPKFLGKDAQLWEKWIFRFAKMKQLKEFCLYYSRAACSLRSDHSPSAEQP